MRDRAHAATAPRGPEASEPQVVQVVEAVAGRRQRVGRGAGRGAGVVALDDVLGDPGLPGVREDPAEVDEAGAGVLEAARGVEVLDVDLADPAAVLRDEVDRVLRADPGPEQVDL